MCVCVLTDDLHFYFYPSPLPAEFFFLSFLVFKSTSGISICLLPYHPKICTVFPYPKVPYLYLLIFHLGKCIYKDNFTNTNFTYYNSANLILDTLFCRIRQSIFCFLHNSLSDLTNIFSV